MRVVTHFDGSSVLSASKRVKLTRLQKKETRHVSLHAEDGAKATGAKRVAKKVLNIVG